MSEDPPRDGVTWWHMLLSILVHVDFVKLRHMSCEASFPWLGTRERHVAPSDLPDCLSRLEPAMAFRANIGR